MSRYSETSPLALSVLKTLQRGSSMNPINLGDILRAHPDASSDIPNAMQALIDARLVSTLTHIVDGTATKLFWPTGLKPLTAKPLRKPAMPTKKPEAGSTTILKYILSHGPITGTDLAVKTSIAARNIDTVLERAGANIVTRIGFVAEKGRELKHYMTPQQAIEWDAKQNKAEIPVNETIEETDEDMPPANAGILASANRMLHEKLEAALEFNAASNAILADMEAFLGVDHRDELLGKVRDMETLISCHERTIQSLHDIIDGMLEDWTNIRRALDVSTYEEALQAITQLNNLSTRQSAIQPGKTALMLIDSDDMTELEMLAPDDDARAMAMTNIVLGHASRVLVVRVMGEANRNAVWKEFA